MSQLPPVTPPCEYCVWRKSFSDICHLLRNMFSVFPVASAMSVSSHSLLVILFSTECVWECEDVSASICFHPRYDWNAFFCKFLIKWRQNVMSTRSLKYQLRSKLWVLTSRFVDFIKGSLLNFQHLERKNLPLSELALHKL
jgi:hypothetical protein